jgi:hypothetical protein
MMKVNHRNASQAAFVSAAIFMAGCLWKLLSTGRHAPQGVLDLNRAQIGIYAGLSVAFALYGVWLFKRQRKAQA